MNAVCATYENQLFLFINNFFRSCVFWVLVIFIIQIYRVCECVTRTEIERDKTEKIETVVSAAKITHVMDMKWLLLFLCETNFYE